MRSPWQTEGLAHHGVLRLPEQVPGVGVDRHQVLVVDEHPGATDHQVGGAVVGGCREPQARTPVAAATIILPHWARTPYTSPETTIGASCG